MDNRMGGNDSMNNRGNNIGGNRPGFSPNNGNNSMPHSGPSIQKTQVSTQNIRQNVSSTVNTSNKNNKKDVIHEFTKVLIGYILIWLFFFFSLKILGKQFGIDLFMYINLNVFSILVGINCLFGLITVSSKENDYSFVSIFNILVLSFLTSPFFMGNNWGGSFLSNFFAKYKIEKTDEWLIKIVYTIIFGIIGIIQVSSWYQLLISFKLSDFFNIIGQILKNIWKFFVKIGTVIGGLFAAKSIIDSQEMPEDERYDEERRKFEEDERENQRIEQERQESLKLELQNKLPWETIEENNNEENNNEEDKEESVGISDLMKKNEEGINSLSEEKTDLIENNITDTTSVSEQKTNENINKEENILKEGRFKNPLLNELDNDSVEYYLSGIFLNEDNDMDISDSIFRSLKMLLIKKKS